MNILQGIFVIAVFFLYITDLKAQSFTQDSTSQYSDTLRSSDPELTNEAIKYYQKLTSRLADYKVAHYNYIKAVTRIRKARIVEKERQGLLKVLQTNKEYCKEFGPFRDDDTLKSEFKRYLDLCYIVLKQDFDKIIDMEDVEAQAYDQAEAHQLALDLAVAKLHASFDTLKIAENAFFKKYHINVKEHKDELWFKIEKANKALDYYDGIWRIFFKSNKEYSYARQAVAVKDVAGLEQHMSTLVSFTGEGLLKLKQQKGFEGDRELLMIAIKMLVFYKEEAEVTFPANIDYQMKVDNFEKARKKFSSIKESDKKQEDVDRYNNEVKVINKASSDVNKINNSSFKTHKQLINVWNKQMDEFFKKHS